MGMLANNVSDFRSSHRGVYQSQGRLKLLSQHETSYCSEGIEEDILRYKGSVCAGHDSDGKTEQITYKEGHPVV